MSEELTDYESWHEKYAELGSALHLRLLVVQDAIALALDSLPAGPVRIISMCAGQGRDLLPAVARHRRGLDVIGRLVEIDSRNVAHARAQIQHLGLQGLDVVEGDGGISDSYAGATPAELVLACGIFGNISDDEVRETIRCMPSMCADGGWVIWTRFPRSDGVVNKILDWFADVGYSTVRVVVPDIADMFGVCVVRLTAPPTPFRMGHRMFHNLL